MIGWLPSCLLFILKSLVNYKFYSIWYRERDKENETFNA